MPDMKSASVVFDDFSGGDYGRDWSGYDTDNKFRAVNVIPYPGGWIGPRQPLVRYNWPDSPAPDTAIWFVDNDILLTADGYAWNVKTGERSVAAAADVTKLRDFSVSFKQNGEMFCVSSDVAVQPSTVIAIRTAALNDTVPTFNDRPTGGDTPMPNGLRLGNHEDSDILAAWRTFYWAEENQAIVWEPENFNYVGRVIYDLVDQKNTLVMLIGGRDSNSVSEGLDGSTRFGFVPGVQVFVVYGTLGATATFRRVDSGPAPAATDTGAFIWSDFGDDVMWFNDRWLMRFNGAEVTVEDAPLPRILHNPDDFSYGPTATIKYWCYSPVKQQGEMILSGSLGQSLGSSSRTGLFSWYHGRTRPMWTAHDPGIEFSSEVVVTEAGDTLDGAALSQRGDGNFFSYRHGENHIMFATAGDLSGEAPKFYQMDITPSFPSTANNDGDTSQPVIADFYTADYWDEQGREIYVDTLTIDYAYNPANSNGFDVSVESLQLWDDNEVRASGPVSFAPPAGGSTSDGTPILRGRTQIPIRTNGSGNGFRVHISNWKGIAIRRIIAKVKFTGGHNG